jgi:hypothetical protein
VKPAASRTSRSSVRTATISPTYPSEAPRIGPHVAGRERPDERLVHVPAEDRFRDGERCRIGDAEALDPLLPDPAFRQGRVDLRTAAVNDHDPVARTDAGRAIVEDRIVLERGHGVPAVLQNDQHTNVCASNPPRTSHPSTG